MSAVVAPDPEVVTPQPEVVVERHQVAPRVPEVTIHQQGGEQKEGSLNGDTTGYQSPPGSSMYPKKPEVLGENPYSSSGLTSYSSSVYSYPTSALYSGSKSPASIKAEGHHSAGGAGGGSSHHPHASLGDSAALNHYSSALSSYSTSLSSMGVGGSMGGATAHPMATYPVHGGGRRWLHLLGALPPRQHAQGSESREMSNQDEILVRWGWEHLCLLTSCVECVRVCKRVCVSICVLTCWMILMFTFFCLNSHGLVNSSLLTKFVVFSHYLTVFLRAQWAVVIELLWSQGPIVLVHNSHRPWPLSHFPP